MAQIKIKRNEAGNCITFEGSSNPVYWNSCLSGEIDSTDSTLINVVNDIITAQSGSKQYEFFRIPFTNFLDADGNSFSTAQECSDYITQEANVLGSIGEQIATPDDEFNFYLDAKDNTVIMSTGDYFPVNTIQASLHTDNTMRINSIVGVKVYYSNINLANVSIDSVLLTGTESDKINTINALFQNTGTSSGNLPVITSSLAVNLTQGDTLNYELTADYGVGYEWDLSSVSGVVNVEGNPRKLIGGSSLTAGTYNIPVKAVNYNGEDSETLVLTVSSPSFLNSKSVQFQQNDYLTSNGGILQNVLGRSGNGSGSSDAWTISFYFKAGTSNNQSQTIVYAGNGNLSGNNHLRIYWNGNNTARQQMCFRYGSNFNNLELKSPVGSIQTGGGWYHVIMTYDGGTTGAASGSVSSYYSRFKMFINGTQQTTINTNQNFGNSSGLTVSEFIVGRYSTSTGYMRNSCKVDELAVWSTDESLNATSIYNSGIVQDLNSLSSSPLHWWRMGDGDTFPFLNDTGSQANCTFIMNNMTAADIVNDVP